MGKLAEIKRRVIVDWPCGKDREPRIFSLADTLEEAQELEETVRRAFKRELANGGGEGEAR